MGEIFKPSPLEVAKVKNNTLTRRGALKLFGLVGVAMTLPEFLTSCSELEPGNTKPVWLPPVADIYVDDFVNHSARYGIDHRIPMIMALVESAYYSRAYHRGTRATGILQILPSTAEDVAKNLGLEAYDLNDPSTNIMMGVDYLNTRWEWVKDKGGDIWDAVCDYYGECKGYTDLWIRPLYEQANQDSSSVYMKWLVAVLRENNGLLLRNAFDEQLLLGVSYDDYIASVFNPKQNKSLALQDGGGQQQLTENGVPILGRNECRTIHGANGNNLPWNIHPGDRIGKLEVKHGDTAYELWLKQGAPADIEVCIR